MTFEFRVWIHHLTGTSMIKRNSQSTSTFLRPSSQDHHETREQLKEEKQRQSVEVNPQLRRNLLLNLAIAKVRVPYSQH